MRTWATRLLAGHGKRASGRCPAGSHRVAGQRLRPRGRTAARPALARRYAVRCPDRGRRPQRQATHRRWLPVRRQPRTGVLLVDRLDAAW